MVLEIPTLVAMAVYALFAWIIVRLIQVATDRPRARMVTRQVHETTPTNVVTTQTTQPTTGRTVTAETERSARVVRNE